MDDRLVKKRPVSSLDYARGILHQDIGTRVFDLQLVEPAAVLKPWIEFYWSVAWDLGDEVFEQIVISNPTVDLSFEDDPGTNAAGLKVFVTGVEPRAYVRRLTGSGRVCAIHFAPGMFRSWWTDAVRTLTGRAIRIPASGKPWERALEEILPRILDLKTSDRANLLDSILVPHRPPLDPVAEELRDLVNATRHDPELWTAGALAARRGYAVRTNQKHFLEYVGVGPKWVIRRFRIQKAIEVLDEDRRQGRSSDLTSIAHSLGYFDHSHFTRDFGAVAGISPSAYRNA